MQTKKNAARNNDLNLCIPLHEKERCHVLLHGVYYILRLTKGIELMRITSGTSNDYDWDSR